MNMNNFMYKNISNIFFTLACQVVQEVLRTAFVNLCMKGLCENLT